MKENFLKTVGLAARARRITFGSDMTLDGAAKGHVALVILSSDASANTEKKARRCCKEYGIPIFKIQANTEELAHAVGKTKLLAVLGITDENLALPIKNSIMDNNGNTLTVSESEVI